MPIVRFTRRYRQFAALIVLPALFLRAFVPMGFMPGDHSGFGVAMQLCTSQGMQTVIVYPDGDAEPATPDERIDSPCAYALGATLGPAPTVPRASLAHAPALPPAQLRSRTVPAAACPRMQSSRGPPALV